MALSIRDRAILAWNSGMTVEDANRRFKCDLSHYFEEFETRCGCKSIPVSEMYKSGRLRMQNLSREYMDWKGITGPGAQLRDIIKRVSSATQV